MYICFLVTQISQMTQIFFIMGFFIHRMTRNLFGDFLLRRLLTEFRGGDLSGRCRYPLRLDKVPQISQIYTDFYSSDATEFIRRFPAAAITHGFSRMRPVRSLQITPETGKVPQISRIYTDFSWDVFIGCHGIYSEVSCCSDYSRIFADATCPVVADTP